MMTNFYHFNALWIMLMLPLAVAKCSSTFLNGMQDLHVLKAKAKTETGGFVSISTNSAAPISLESVNKIYDVGCMGNQALGYKLRMLHGDQLKVRIDRGEGTLQIRTMRLLDKCPGTIYVFGGKKSRCHSPMSLYTLTASTRQDVLIFLQPAENQQMTLSWSYTPNPARQVDTCIHRQNNVCDYDSGKCLAGTDCTDCEGTNCKPTKCLTRYSDSQYWPSTCDNPLWKSHPLGPMDCKAIEREIRRDCSGCACQYTDPCTDEKKNSCRAAHRGTCARGSNTCGRCLKGYVEKDNKCQPNPCNQAAKDACKKANRHSCDGDSFECGDCLGGFMKVANVCVDVSKCTSSNVPSKMVILIDTSGSLDNPRSGGSYGNFAEVKNFAKDLIQVFPINEFAIRSFSHTITSYPASGAFVDKRAARENIDAMRYDNSLTYTGSALEHTVKLLENERDSLNMVLVFTDGQATDGKCKSVGYTCNKDTQLCENSNGQRDGRSCKLIVQADKLQNLPDRNATVTVVSVGFGNINADELRLVASGDDGDNTIIAQGADASAGLAKLETLLGTLVDKVCLNLPVDCVIEYTEWSKCPTTCGEHWQVRKISDTIAAKNNGKACPTGKALNKNFYRKCPEDLDCKTSTTTTKAAVTTTTKPTVTTRTTPAAEKSTTKISESKTTAGGKVDASSGSTVTTKPGNKGDVTTKSGNKGDVTTEPGNKGDVTTKSGNKGDVTTEPDSGNTGDEASENNVLVDASVVNTLMWTLAIAFSFTMLIV